MSQTASVGRIVHYMSYGTPGGEYSSKCRAAIVTQVGFPDEETIGVAVLNPTGLFFTEFCEHSEVPEGGTWHWPERT